MLTDSGRDASAILEVFNSDLATLGEPNGSGGGLCEDGLRSLVERPKPTAMLAPSCTSLRTLVCNDPDSDGPRPAPSSPKSWLNGLRRAGASNGFVHPEAESRRCGPAWLLRCFGEPSPPAVAREWLCLLEPGGAELTPPARCVLLPGDVDANRPSRIAESESRRPVSYESGVRESVYPANAAKPSGVGGERCAGAARDLGSRGGLVEGKGEPDEVESLYGV